MEFIEDEINLAHIYGFTEEQYKLAAMFSTSRKWYDEIRYASYKRNYNIHNSVKFSGTDIILSGEGTIEIGENTYICSYSCMESYEGSNIYIGKNNSISHNVRIYTLNRIPQIYNSTKMTCKQGNIHISDNCLIGANVFIKEGVYIGDNAFIGANSVVTESIPSYSVAAGNPARVISTIDH